MHESVSHKDAIVSTARALVALGAVLAFIRLFHIDMDRSHAGTLFSLGFLVLAGTAGGHLAALLGFPRLTGYLVAGLLSGPAGFTIISKSEVGDLTLINNLALALIALQAGTEFTNQMLKRNLKSLVYGTLSHVIVMGVGITALVYAFSTHFGWLGSGNPAKLFAISAVLGVLAVSKSPAAVVAVLSETKAQGPLSEHALGIVVLLDVIVMALFTALLVFSRSAIDPQATIDLRQLRILAQDLIVSIAAGCTIGLLMGFYLRFINKERILFLLLSAYGISSFCRYFNYDTMLVFVTAGYIVTNLAGQGKRMVETIESVSTIVMLIFFATAGASLHVDQLRKAWQLVAVVLIGRLILTWVAAQIGHWFAEDRPPVKTLGFTPFVSQAGVAIGLAILVGEKIPGEGAVITAVGISFISLNEMIGPILFKWGLRKAGELP